MNSSSSAAELGPGLSAKTFTDEQAAAASLWRTLVVRCFKMAELGRDVGLA
jgi:hypothetical protein